MLPNGFAVWLVADFEALSYQVTTTFDTSCATRIPNHRQLTIPRVVPMLLIPIYQLLIILLNDKLVKYQLEIH